MSHGNFYLRLAVPSSDPFLLNVTLNATCSTYFHFKTNPKPTSILSSSDKGINSTHNTYAKQH